MFVIARDLKKRTPNVALKIELEIDPKTGQV
jgi:hypothetical protein